MGVFSSLRSIYALDTLDTRFTSSPKVPYQAVVDARDGQGITPSTDVPVKLDSRRKPIPPTRSLWKTTEFYLYYTVVTISVAYMFWVAFDVSRPSDPNYYKYERWLAPGWIPGRRVDVSDAQYRTFRRNTPYIFALLLVHPVLRRVYERLRPISATFSNNGKFGQPGGAAGDARLEQRTSFDFVFALIFLAALHGFSVFKVVFILYLNYSLATKLPKKYIVPATWIFAVGTLFANEIFNGYPYAKIEKFLMPWASQSSFQGGAVKLSWGSWLDGYSGIMPRWAILFNLTVLRLVSFNIDYYWSLDHRAGSPLEKKQLDPANLSENDRIRTSAPAKDYNFRNYLAYAIYAPLYLVGPIVTYNDFISQCKYRSPTIESSRTLKYGIRLFLTFLCMEFILHFDYCVAISKANPVWSDYSAKQLSIMSLFNLHIVWLKLLLPWRLFRFWALLDGIDPPENMIRCVSDSFSTVRFWRAWHRSFNKWIVRYLYIPLGGSNITGRFGLARTILNYLVVFTFVALWHDISLNLLVWGWLIVLFMLPEIIGTRMFPRSKWENNLKAWRMLCAAGSVLNVIMMMSANLVGFAVGVDGMKSIIHGIFSDWGGIAFLLTAAGVLFTAIQIMFEVRESEIRNGIDLKC
ncbi:hypothetical protein VE00_04954 [Pseudogymnoascus sp. WSF 3629]|nr:hypothetical protein VE00_04954 [Pseudogymnoascus sp. WSF 3629]